jgi:hypothetical protein
MFKPHQLRFIIMLNLIIIHLTRGFHRYHYHLPGAVDGMAVIMAAGTVAVMAAGTTEMLIESILDTKKAL